MRVTRVGKMFNHKGQRGVFDISRSKFYRDLVLTNPADPNIPNTDIPRLRLVYLGGKSVGVDDDDISRVVLALQDFYARKAARKSPAGGSLTMKPPFAPTATITAFYTHCANIIPSTSERTSSIRSDKRIPPRATMTPRRSTSSTLDQST